MIICDFCHSSVTLIGLKYVGGDLIKADKETGTRHLCHRCAETISEAFKAKAKLEEPSEPDMFQTEIRDDPEYFF